VAAEARLSLHRFWSARGGDTARLRWPETRRLSAHVAGGLGARRSIDVRPFWTLVSIRVGFWFLAALSLLWSPLRADIPPFRAYGARSDLFFGTFAQWDSGWFLRIAQRGYDVKESTAFFPVYPLLVRGVSAIVGSTLVAGVLVSLVSGGIAAILLAEIAKAVIGEEAAGDAVLYVALYPIAFVFTGVYAEGLFLALTTGSVLAAMRGRPWLAGVCGGLAVVTRLAGLALVPVLLYLLWKRPRERRAATWPLPVLLLPAALEGYRLYLGHRFGDPLAFKHVLKSYWTRDTPHLGPVEALWEAVSAGGHGALRLVRDLPAAGGSPGGFGQADQLAAWNVVHLMLLVCVAVLTWIAWRRLGPALGLYALVVDIVLLTTTVRPFPLQSFPRYVLANFPLFLALAVVTSTRPRLRQAVLIAFGAVGGVSAVAFAHHTWIA
jgi:hypothetical protein